MSFLGHISVKLGYNYQLNQKMTLFIVGILNGSKLKPFPRKFQGNSSTTISNVLKDGMTSFIAGIIDGSKWKPVFLFCFVLFCFVFLPNLSEIEQLSNVTKDDPI